MIFGLGLAASVLAAAPLPAPAPATLGTAHPVRLLAASPDGRWAVLCETRQDTDGNGVLDTSPGFNGLYGDQMEAVLVLGSGPGTAIDDLISYDPTGRELVILRDRKLVLLDTHDGSEVDLSALGAYDRLFRDPKTDAYLLASFDPAGQHLAYLKIEQGHVKVIVRELSTGHETKVDPGPGKFVSADFDRSGAHILVQALPGKWAPARVFEPPFVGVHPLCQTRTGSDVVTSVSERPVNRLASIKGGVAREDPGYLDTLGSSTLRREPKGPLVLEDSAGSHELLSATCLPRVQGVDAEHGRVLALCLADGKKAHLLLVGVGLKRDLGPKPNISGGTSSDASVEDKFVPFGRHVFVTDQDGDDTVIDVETGERRRTSSWQEVLASWGDRTLVSRQQTLILLDGPNETVLGHIDERYPKVLKAGSLRYVAPLLIDLAQGKIIGSRPTRELPFSPGDSMMTTVNARVWAISTDGRLLGLFSTFPREFASGPMEWLTPEPPQPLAPEKSRP